VRVEISGVRGEDLRVNVDGDLVRVSGVRRVPVEAEVRRLHQMEIAFGPFERAVRIAVPFDREGVSAHLEDGFLLVTLPKSLPQRRKIEVETG
jgi:HSP20 family protein